MTKPLFIPEQTLSAARAAGYQDAQTCRDEDSVQALVETAWSQATGGLTPHAAPTYYRDFQRQYAAGWCRWLDRREV